MIAYNKTLLNNTLFIDGARELHDAGFITNAQLSSAALKRPQLKTHRNLLIRTGFFLLGCFLYSSCSGVIALFTGMFDSDYKVSMFIFALIGFAALEFLARKNYWCFGLDDAFLIGAQAIFIGFVAVTINNESVIYLIAAATGLFCSIRYINTASVLVLLCGLTGFTATIFLNYKLVNIAFLPFAGLILAIIFFVIHGRLKPQMSRYYENPLIAVKAFSLILAYLSVNYLVVRELSEELMNIIVKPGKDIPFAWIFYTLTFAIPLAYMYFGMMLKSKIFLWTGMLVAGFSIFTIRFYYSVLPAEIALVAGGIFLFAAAYLFIRKLKHRESGITFLPARNSDSTSQLFAQAIITNSAMDANHAGQTSEMPFGAGGFSGGGAGESY